MQKSFFYKSSEAEAGAVIIGYFAACLAAVLATTAILTLPALGQPRSTEPLIESLLAAGGVAGAFFFVLLVVGFPGFILLRRGLDWLGRIDWLSFAVAGAINANLVMIIFRNPFQFSAWKFIEYPLTPFISVIGGLAGFTSWAAERWVAKRSRVKTSKVENL